MKEIKFDELMDLDELDNIVGGANGYIYYVHVKLETQGTNGYHLVISKNPMTKEQIYDFVAFSVPFNYNDSAVQVYVDYEHSKNFFDDVKTKGYEVIDYAKMKD